VTISTNGWREFGGNTQGTSHPANVCLPTNTHTNPFLAAYWDDLNPFGSIIRYGTVGTSPDRTFIVDYEVDLTSGSEGSDDLRFQVQVHETSNLINVRYRDQQSATNGISATIGFQGAGGASGNAQPITCNGKVMDDNRSDEGWSIDASRAGQVVLFAFMEQSPDDLSGSQRSRATTARRASPCRSPSPSKGRPIPAPSSPPTGGSRWGPTPRGPATRPMRPCRRPSTPTR
jgi:hypothetical protein